jgi:ammonium transporter, Amt family
VCVCVCVSLPRSSSLSEQTSADMMPLSTLLVAIATVATSATNAAATVAVTGSSSGSSSAPPTELTTPNCVNSGDTSWVLISTIIVYFMIPALGLFEAGMLRQKNTLSIFTQIICGVAVMLVMWFLFGFSLVFGSDVYGLIGDLRFVGFRDLDGLCTRHATTIPGTAFAIFTAQFASITPLLVTGSFAERMKFKSAMVFMTIWEVIVYYPIAHSLWGNGLLQQLGVLDFAGGIVIHATSGAAALVAALMLGRRADFDEHHGEPHPSNLPLAFIGAAMLWTGWNGFNAGSALRAGGLASFTVTSTILSMATSVVVSMVLSNSEHGVVRTVDVINGGIAGMAGITPASGFVRPWAAVVIGGVCGITSWYCIKLFKHKLRIDDALDVSSVHGATGIAGSLLLGVFADHSVNAEAGDDGWAYGNPMLMAKQLLGVTVAVVWSSVWTYVLFKFKYHTIGLKVDEDVEEEGLDSEHGSHTAYHELWTSPVIAADRAKRRALRRAATESVLRHVNDHVAAADDDDDLSESDSGQNYSSSMTAASTFV